MTRPESTSLWPSQISLTLYVYVKYYHSDTRVGGIQTNAGTWKIHRRFIFSNIRYRVPPPKFLNPEDMLTCVWFVVGLGKLVEAGLVTVSIHNCVGRAAEGDFLVRIDLAVILGLNVNCWSVLLKCNALESYRRSPMTAFRSCPWLSASRCEYSNANFCTLLWSGRWLLENTLTTSTVWPAVIGRVRVKSA